MIDFDERWFHIRRAQDCRERADAAANKQVARIHYELRDLHLERADITPLKPGARKVP